MISKKQNISNRISGIKRMRKCAQAFKRFQHIFRNLKVTESSRFTRMYIAWSIGFVEGDMNNQRAQ